MNRIVRQMKVDVVRDHVHIYRLLFESLFSLGDGAKC
jgi:hypothetical protein